jgi:hypothetical protein
VSADAPPLDLLLNLASCSKTSLGGIKLARYNRSANSWKELKALLEEIFEEWVRAEAEARAAEWLEECRQELGRNILPFPRQQSADQSARSDVSEPTALDVKESRRGEWRAPDFEKRRDRL